MKCEQSAREKRRVQNAVNNWTLPEKSNRAIRGITVTGDMVRESEAMGRVCSNVHLWRKKSHGKSPIKLDQASDGPLLV